MTAFFLVAVMIWHDVGNNYYRRYAVLPIDSAELCEAVVDKLRDDWRKEQLSATIVLECVPVLRPFKA